MTEIIALAAAALLIGLDQLTKWLIITNFKVFENRTVIKGVLDFTYVQNTGAAFGILKNHRWIFMAATAIVILIGLGVLITRKIKSKWLIWAVSLVIAGGVGNMIDRVFRGFVIDFIEATFVKFYIFNVADICVVVGAIMMILYFIKDALDEHKRQKAGMAEPEENPEETVDKEACETVKANER